MRRKMRSGFLKMYTLKLLFEGEKTGYGLMKTIEEETGFWKPSAGSIYPLLKSLEEAGLAEHREQDDKKIYSLTEKGRKAFEEAEDARAEIRESINRSRAVFGNIFGEKFPPPPDPLERIKKPHRADISNSLKKRLIELKEALFDIKFQDLSSKEEKEIVDILDRAINSLEKFADPYQGSKAGS